MEPTSERSTDDSYLRRALPIMAIITPGTLTVRTSSQANETNIHRPIPVLDYNNQIFIPSPNEKTNISISFHLARVLLTVASLGTILNIPAPFPNSTYSVKYFGPMISCSRPKSASLVESIGDIVDAHTREDGLSVIYAGFAPTLSTEVKTESGRVLGGLRETLDDSLIMTAPLLDWTANSSAAAINESRAKLYLVVPGNLGRVANKPIECQLYNSSYHTDFNFTNGQQAIQWKQERLNGVSAFHPFSCRHRNSHECDAAVAYLSIMGAFGDFLVGKVMQPPGGASQPSRTLITRSVLMDTKEMQVPFTNLVKSTIGDITMSDALEQLFVNFTISLFSDAKFL